MKAELRQWESWDQDTYGHGLGAPKDMRHVPQFTCPKSSNKSLRDIDSRR